MASITINLSNEQLSRLQELARSNQVSPEEFLGVSIEDLLTSPKKDFPQASSYVLKKNVELYRRLA
ncbi:DNA-binding protein [Picosynechococcus sp. PCC 7003]|uniref:DNA-binding protein n=1 Tax=Picosynechococcus sp. PCC 7003 TaxID=374981 RepID=UPI0009044A1E|nr:DNA-binding protein [Picosynechococcus sp. PCC 7003]